MAGFFDEMIKKAQEQARMGAAVDAVSAAQAVKAEQDYQAFQAALNAATSGVSLTSGTSSPGMLNSEANLLRLQKSVVADQQRKASNKAKELMVNQPLLAADTSGQVARDIKSALGSLTDAARAQWKAEKNTPLQKENLSLQAQRDNITGKGQSVMDELKSWNEWGQRFMARSDKKKGISGQIKTLEDEKKKLEGLLAGYADDEYVDIINTPFWQLTPEQQQQKAWYQSQGLTNVQIVSTPDQAAQKSAYESRLAQIDKELAKLGNDLSLLEQEGLDDWFTYDDLSPEAKRYYQSISTDETDPFSEDFMQGLPPYKKSMKDMLDIASIDAQIGENVLAQVRNTFASDKEILGISDDQWATYLAMKDTMGNDGQVEKAVDDVVKATDTLKNIEGPLRQAEGVEALVLLSQIGDEPDFEQYSKYMPMNIPASSTIDFDGVNIDAVYRLINTGNIGQGGEGIPADDMWEDSHAYAFLYPHERDRINYLINKGRYDEAKAILEALREPLLARRRENHEAKNIEKANALGPFAWLASGVANAADGLLAIPRAIKGMVEGYMSPNDPAFDASVYASDIRNTQAQAADDALVGLFGDGVRGWGSFLYGVGTSALDMGIAMGTGALAGKVAMPKVAQFIMSSEAAGGAYKNALDRGLTVDKAVVMAVAAGSIEALTEKYSIETLLKDRDIIWQYVLQNMGTEATEEGISEITNTIVDILVNGDQSELGTAYNALIDKGIDPKDAAWQVGVSKLGDIGLAMAGGALMGGGMASIPAAVTGAKRASVGKAINANEAYSQLRSIAMTLEGTKAQATAKGLEGKKKISNQVAGRLYQQVMEGLSKEAGESVRQAMTQMVADRLTELGEKGDVQAGAAALQKMWMGGKLNAQDRAAIDSLDNAQQVMGEVFEQQMTDVATAAALPYQMRMTQVHGLTRKQAPKKAVNDAEISESLADAEKGFNAETAQGQIMRVASIGDDPQIVVQREGGKEETVPLSQLEADSYNTRYALGQISASGMSVESANEMLAYARVQGGNTRTFVNDFTQVYRDGVNGYGMTMASNMAYGKRLAPEIRQKAYDAGQRDSEAQYRAQVRRDQQKGKRRGKVTFEGITRDSLNDQQLANVEVMEAIADKLGVDIVFFASKADAAGRYQGEQGSYKDGVIRLDVNAGRNNINDKAQYAILRTAAHELTHHIAERNRADYQRLQRFVVDNLMDKGLEQLIEEKQAQYAAQGVELTREQAIEEVVADGCEMMLKDSQAIQKLVEQDRNLAQKVLDWLRNFVDKLRKAFDGVSYEHREAALLMQKGTLKYLEGLQEMWDQALMGTVEGNTTGMDGAKLQARVSNRSMKMTHYYTVASKHVMRLNFSDHRLINAFDYDPIEQIDDFEEVIVRLQTRALSGEDNITFETAMSKKGDEMKLILLEKQGDMRYSVVDVYKLSTAQYEGRVSVLIDLFEKGAKKRNEQELNSWLKLVGESYGIGLFFKYNRQTSRFVKIGPGTSGKRRTAAGAAGAGSNGGGTVGGGGQVKFALRSSVTETDTAYLDAIKRGDMAMAQRMVDEAAENAGYAVRGYHGTTNLFTVFDISKSNIENDWGRGIYASTNKEDVETNYAAEDGADLVNRIERLAEMMENWDEYADMDDEERLEAARKQLSEGESTVLRVALRMDNPVVVKHGRDGTLFTYEEEYDEETDEYSEPGGTLIEVVEAMREIIAEDYEWYSDEADRLNELYSEAYDDGGIYAERLQAAVNELLVEVSDEDGNLASSDILRSALERIGYDGIIDNTVAYKFGELSGRGKPMRGVTSKTTHYIVFSSEQVKLTDPVTYDNDGNVIPLSHRFNKKNSDIRYQLRDGDTISSREALANALQSTAQNDRERELLAQYKGIIKELDEDEAKLAKHKGIIRDLSFKKGGLTAQEKEELEKAKNRAQIVQNRLNRNDKKLLELESTKALKAVVEREKAKAEKRIREQKKEALARYRERTKDTQSRAHMRDRIKDEVKKLNKLLTQETDTKHVPEDLKGAVADFLTVFVQDTSVFSKAKLDELRYAYGKISDKASADEMSQLSAMYDEDITRDLEELRGVIDGKRLAELDASETKKVLDIVRHFNKLIKEANWAFVDGRRQSISTMVHTAVQQADAKKPYKEIANSTVSAVRKLLRTEQITPPYFFKELGGIMKQLWDDLKAGESKVGLNVQKAQDFFYATADKYHYWDWAHKKNDVLEMTTQQGHKIALSREQAMGLYATWKREMSDNGQQAGHLQQGGFILEEKVTKGKNGKIDIDTRDPHKMTDGDMNQVASWLTEEQRGYVDEMVRYMSVDMAALGNETSMALFGYKKYGEPFYYPYNSSKNFTYTALGQQVMTNDQRLKHSSFTRKTVQFANNPIIASDFTQVWSAHVNHMILYNAMCVPLENFNRVYNGRYTDVLVDEETGEPMLDAEGKPMKGSMQSVKQALEAAYGKNALRYIENLMADLNGGVRVRTDGMASALVGKFKKSAVMMSMSVVVQQPSAMVRAMALVNPKYFMPGLSMGGSWKELKKYSGIAVIKEMGGFDTQVGQSTQDWLIQRQYEGMEKLSKEALMDKGRWNDLMGWLPGKADQMTWTWIWGAVKAEVADKTGLTGEALMQEAAKRFDEVVSYTQVYDSTLSRSQLMRSKDGLAKMVTSFMSEPTLTYNMLMDALVNRGKADSVNPARAIGAFVATAVVNALLKSLVTAARDDDKEKSLAEKYVGNVVENVTNDVNPLNLIPYARDIVSLLQGYDVERTDMSLVNDLITGVQKALTDDDLTMYERVMMIAQPVAAAFGIPLKNVMRDLGAVVNVATGTLAPENSEFVALAALDALPFRDSGKTAYYERVLDARAAGDDREEELLTAYLTSSMGVSEKTIKSKTKEALGNRYKAGRITDSKAIDILTDYYDLDDDDAYWQLKEWREKAAHKEDEDFSFSRQGELKETLESGNSQQVKAAQKELTDNGYAEKDVYSDTRSAIKAMYKDGKINWAKAKSLLTSHGGSDWVKEQDTHSWYWLEKEWAYDKANKDNKNAPEYSKYATFKAAIPTGKGLYAAARELLDHGVEKGDISGVISKTYKEEYIRLQKTDKTKFLELRARLLTAYDALGYKRSDRIKHLDKYWVE